MVGAALLAAACLPAHRLLDPAVTGAAGAATRDVGEALWGLTLWGTVLALALAIALAVLARGVALGPALEALGDRLFAAGARSVAAAAGVSALLLSAAAALWVFDGLPTLADAMVQLVQARAWANGALAAPASDPVAARMLQNGIATAEGWVSVYPPGHTALLALGLKAGVPWLVGPLLTGVTALFATLAARRALPDRPRAALLGGLLAALSPFLLLLGGGYLSHSSAAAAGALACWAALRARDGAARWALVAGLAMGAMVTSRPWTGLVLGAAVTAGIWAAAAIRSAEAGVAPTRWLGARLGMWALGGLPFAALLGMYNGRFFGGPLALGYDAAFGPAHGLGWHVGPWGDAYGAREALAYSGFDLMALGGHLFETPVSPVALVGLWLLVARTLPRGTGVLLAWALAPVAANAAYWHHGYHLGPRMLYEAAPAWCMLTALAVVELARRGGRLGAAAVWVAVIAVPAGLVLQLPGRIEASRWTEDARARATPPPGDGGPALVFVHGNWPGRVAARLAASGMRRDSIETALRRNDLCLVQRFVDAREGIAGAAVPLDFTPVSGSPSSLAPVEVAPGLTVRLDPRLVPAPTCLHEARADREGTIELEPLAWQTAVPGLEEGVLFFRDLGPDANARVRARHPGLPAWTLLPADGGALLPYEETVLRLWGSGASGG